MTPAEVSDHCNRAKVYIDFGHHPGKDRMPREAAIAGCCIVTGRQGAAKFPEDIFIPDVYKIDETRSDFVHEFGRTISNIFEAFEENAEHFDDYRTRIRTEKSDFMDQVASIF